MLALALTTIALAAVLAGLARREARAEIRQAQGDRDLYRLQAHLAYVGH